MPLPIIVGRSNDVESAVAAVRAHGFDGDRQKELEAIHAHDVRALEFAHVVLGVKRVPRAISTSTELRVHKTCSEWTWVGGTLAAWARTLDQADFVADLRVGIVGTLGRWFEIPFFGNARWLSASGTDIAFHTPALAEAHAATGGLVVLTLNRDTEALFVQHGARVLARADDTHPPTWAERGAKANGRPDSTRHFALPMALDTLSEKDRKLVQGYFASYRRLQTDAENPALRAALRSPIEATDVLFVVDHATLDAVEATTDLTAQRLAREARAAFDAVAPPVAALAVAGAA